MKKDQKSKKAHCTILKCFTKQGMSFFDDYSSMISEAKAKAKATQDLK